jgi:hypothetical protein
MAGTWECPACGAVVPDADFHSCGKMGAVIEREDAERMLGIDHLAALERVAQAGCDLLHVVDGDREGNMWEFVDDLRAALDALTGTGES